MPDTAPKSKRPNLFTRRPKAPRPPRATPGIGRFVPGVLGAVFISAGLALIWPPLGLVALGGFLLILDWRLG